MNELPDEDTKWLHFTEYAKKEQAPYMVYADLECILEKVKVDDNKSEHTSCKYQHYKVFSIGYYVYCYFNKSLFVYRFHRDPNCITWFVQQLEQLAFHVNDVIYTNVSMSKLSKEQRKEFDDATQCHVCEKPFAMDNTRVRDHCHLTGRYRGPAHQTCNLKYQDYHCIPIIFHNLSGYDSHFIIEEIASAFEGSVDILPITKEKYISFTKSVNHTPKHKWKQCIKLRLLIHINF